MKKRLLKIIFLLTAGGGLLGVSAYFQEKIFQDELYAEIYQALPLKNEEKVIAPNSIKVPIVVYHSIRPFYGGESAFVKKFDVPPDIFEKEMQYLQENSYTPISFANLTEHFHKGTPLPPKPVILTLDDGWENQYTYALPLLKKYGYSATFFIFTNAIGHKHFLTWQEIEELVKSGMIIGSHTKSHPYLDKITDPNQLRGEIVESKKILEEHLHREIYVFASPFGYSDEKIVKIVKDAGYRAARTSYKGTHHAPDDLFSLRSIQAPNTMEKFKHELNR